MVYKNDIKMTADKRFETGDESGQSGQSYVLKTRRPFFRKPKNGSNNNNSKDLAELSKAEEDGKVMHYRVFKPNPEPTHHNPENQGTIGIKDSKMFPVPQLQLPGPVNYFPGGFQYSGNNDQQLAGHQQPVFYPDHLHQQNTVLQPAFSQPQFNPYQINPYPVEGLQQEQMMPSSMQPIENFPGHVSSAGYPVHPGQSAAGYLGQNVGAGFPGYPGLLDTKNELNSGEQLLTPTYPTWSTQEIAGITPGPPGISPALVPGVSPGGALQHNQYGGAGVQGMPITPSAGVNTVFSFPSVLSYNSLCLTPTNQDNKAVSFDPSVPPPFSGWSRSGISLPESVQNGFPTGPYSSAMLPSVPDPAGYWPHPGQPLTTCSSVSLIHGFNPGYSVDNGYMSLGYAPQQIPDPSQGYVPPHVQVPNLSCYPQQIPDPMSGQIPGLVFPPGSYYPNPSIWNNSDDFGNQNVQQFPAQPYYEVSAAMPLPSQRSDGADSGVISDFANLTIGDSYESTTSKEDTSKKEEDGGGDNINNSNQAQADSKNKDSVETDVEKANTGGVNDTPDIVKSVESKAEEVKKPNQAQIISTEVSNKMSSVPETCIGQETPAAGPDGQTYIPCQIQNPGDLAVASQGQGATYYSYGPYTAPNPEQFGVQNGAPYHGPYPMQNNGQYAVHNYAGQYPMQSTAGPGQYSVGPVHYSTAQPGGPGQYSTVQPGGQLSVQNGLYMPVPGSVYYD